MFTLYEMSERRVLPITRVTSKRLSFPVSSKKKKRIRIVANRKGTHTHTHTRGRTIGGWGGAKRKMVEKKEKSPVRLIACRVTFAVVRNDCDWGEHRYPVAAAAAGAVDKR